MTVRNVNSVVLRELAGSIRGARGELESRFNTSRSRVDSAPGGWDRGAWEGVPGFIRMELEAMDREQRELMDRAAKIDVVAAVTELPEALPLSALKFLLSMVSGGGFSFYLAGGAATGLVATVAAFTKEFTAKNGKAPQLGDFAALRLNLDNKTAGSSGQMKPARRLLPDGTYGSRYTGKVVVNGKVLTDAEIYERASAIRKAYKDVYGSDAEPSDGDYDTAMTGGKSLDSIRAAWKYDKDFEEANVQHINQVKAERDSGRFATNANCGPASLAMSLRLLGVSLPSDDGEAVDLMREKATGVKIRELPLEKQEIESGTNTNFTQLAKAAVAMGARAANPTESVDDARKALASGSKVLVVGSFRDKPWSTDQTTPSGPHIVAVTGYNEATGEFLVSDPMNNAPLEVTAEQLSSFTTADPQGGMLVISK